MTMSTADTFKEYVSHLFAGRRINARDLVLKAQDQGKPAAKLLKKIIWPAMEQIDKLYREDHISLLVKQMSERINRTVADQLQRFLAREPKTGQRMVITCGAGEISELGAQVMADLFEAQGWTVWFLGADVPSDEILQFIGKVDPDILCIYGVQPSGVAEVRKLIDMIRGVGVCEQMQVLVSGGVFNRAEGLDEEVKADLFAADIEEALETVRDHPVRVPRPDMPQPGRRRKRKQSAAQAAAIRKAKKVLQKP
ncbi:MAG: cobalamin-dependent protein [Phycisphaerae bacterium]|nr:cobalamin-dependent protein [Phycisphaerae bacterium]